MNINKINQHVLELVKICKEESKKIWLSPKNLEKKVETYLEGYVIKYNKVVVLGSVKECSIFIVLDEKIVLLITPHGEAKHDEIIKELNLEKDIRDGMVENYCYLKLTENLLRRLKVPEIVLVNLCNIELRPIPRLNLSTATIASYLRCKKSAKVTIIDMQFGKEIAEVIKECILIQPDVIGLSVDFKEQQIAEKLIEQIQEKIEKSKIVIGNIIPALLFEDFLRKYPSVIVSYAEGERSWYDITRYADGKIKVEEVSGIKYLNNNEVIINKVEYVDMNEIQTPALDTVPLLEKYKGVLTLETSRGCDYSLCTFCPRHHKSSTWRCLSEVQVVEQIKDLLWVTENFNIPRHIYFADEEFIGEINNKTGVKRVINIAEELLKIDKKFKLDIAVRVDSVYDSKQDKAFSVETVKMWNLLKKVGVDRIFVGIESGSLSQLKRFGKGTTPEQSIIALRILTALGIEVRLGFIMFDALMEDFSELKENIDFLNVKNAILNQVIEDTDNYERIYDNIVNKKEFIEQHSKDRAIYNYVSYMVTPLEILMNSKYAQMVRNKEKKLGKALIYKCDLEMGKLESRYLNDEIGKINECCKEWVDKNYALMYTIKSLAKAATMEEKKVLYELMYEYRKISHYMSSCLIGIYTQIEDKDFAEYISEQKINMSYKKGKDVLREWDSKVMNSFANKIDKLLEQGTIKDTPTQKLGKILKKWYETRL